MNEAVAAAQTDGNALSRSLRPRHVAMITIGGIIGAGLFVGSSVAITAAGPAIVGAYACGYRSPSGPTFSNLVAHGGFAPQGAFAVLASVVTVIWSMMGSEVVTIAAAESPEPARAVARMTSTIISRILMFYVGSVFVIVSTVPWNRVVAGQSPFTLALDEIHFPYASEFMAAVILTAVLSCLNSAFYVASRVLFVLASRGDAPRWLVRTNRRQVPARAVLLAGAVGFAGVIAAILSPSVVFAFLVNASGAIIAVIYLAIAVSQVRSRRARERAGGPAPALPMWLFPWLSYLAIAAMVLVLIAMALTPSHRAEVWTSTISIGVTLLAYVLFRRRRK